MVRLMRDHEALQVIDDQIGAPTGAELIADGTAHAIRQCQADDSRGGLYHLVAGGETSWHGYATFIARYLKEQGVAIQTTPERIQSIPTRDWPTPAQRPLNSRLDTTALENEFSLSLPHWQDGVARVLHKTLRQSASDRSS